MPDEERINPGHTQVRGVLRLVGPIVLGVGVILMIVGLGSFFSSFGTFEPPRYFWCCFLGMPLIMIGLVMSQFGFMGAITRYQAGEVAPVGKDTFNYMADRTKGGLKTVASAIGAGLSEGISGAANRWGHTSSNVPGRPGASQSFTASSAISSVPSRLQPLATGL